MERWRKLKLWKRKATFKTCLPPVFQGAWSWYEGTEIIRRIAGALRGLAGVINSTRFFRHHRIAAENFIGVLRRNCFLEKEKDETYLSTAQAPSRAQTWISWSHGDAQRACRDLTPSQPGPSQADASLKTDVRCEASHLTSGT
jgi:hypothetical protein